MAIDKKMFANKVSRYCAQFNSGYSEISVKTGILPERLHDLMDGRAEPTGDEVLILADYFKCDYSFFISNERTDPFEETEQFFRAHSKELSTEDRWNIQEFLFLCENQYFLLKENPSRNILNFHHTKKTHGYREQGIQAAKELRIALGYNDISVSKNVYTDFRRLGINIFRRKLGRNSISGIYIVHPIAGKCILVNYMEDVYRQRFTVAHEIGHTLLDDDQGKPFSISYNNGSSQTDSSEVRANNFASQFLIPDEILHRLPNKSSWNSSRIIEISKRLMVNPQPLTYALSRLNLISKQQVTEFENLRINHADKNDPELPDDLPQNTRKRKQFLLKKGLSDFYVTLCIDSYEAGNISRGKLVEILLIDESELDDIFSLYRRKVDYGI